jgi:hypothetical protein
MWSSVVCGVVLVAVLAIYRKEAINHLPRWFFALNALLNLAVTIAYIVSPMFTTILNVFSVVLFGCLTLWSAAVWYAYYQLTMPEKPKNHGYTVIEADN